jgi:hypothetical protein
LAVPGRRSRYADSDLLVPAAEFGRAERVLRSLGFTELLEGFHPFELGLGQAAAEIAVTRRDELHPGRDGTVDLHRNLPRLPTPDNLLWQAFSAGAQTALVGGVEVLVPGRTALALHGLSHLETGAGIVDRIGLPSLPPADRRVWSMSAPKGSASLAEFWSAPTLRAKASWIRWMLLPSRWPATSMPLAASRADSMAWAMTDRQTLAVQSRRISVTLAIQSLTVNLRVLLAR